MISLRTAAERTRAPSSPAVVDLLQSWEPERLMLLGSGPLPVDGATGGAVALDGSGVALLAVNLDAVMPRTPSQIADELDRMAQMDVGDLDTIGSRPEGTESLEDRFGDAFHAPTPATGLNHDQAAVLIVGTEPTAGAWRRLQVELGPRLRGVFRLDPGGALIRLDAPAVPLTTPLPLRTRLGGAAVALGLILALAALARGFWTTGAPVTAVGSSRAASVATGVPVGATHTQWIGQQHLLHTSDGRLLALLSVPAGLEIVSDRADNGASWAAPFTVPSIHPASFSAAADPEGKIHLAFTDRHGISYVVLTPSGRGWKPSGPPLRLDRHTKTPVVDVAWDPRHGVAHVVWARSSSSGESPFWAAVGARRNKLAVLSSKSLSAPGRAETVLANDAVDPVSGRLTVTYRRGGTSSGWSSRSARPLSSQKWKWSRPEPLPTHAFIGASALALDAGGTAHLVLRDSTNYRLLYFTQPPGGRWSEAEVAVQAHATSQVDFPALALDASSQVVYLFFETDQFETSPEIRVALRDPSSGWQPSVSVAGVPQGDYFPTALRNGAGQAIAMWTQGSSSASVRAGRFLGP